MSNTLGEDSFAGEQDASFIPMLCDQLDAVYARYRQHQSAELDDSTRSALQRALHLLIAARPDTRDRKAGHQIDRAVGQTEEILARYPPAPTAEQATAAEVETAVQPEAEMTEAAPVTAANGAAPPETAGETVPTETALPAPWLEPDASDPHREAGAPDEVERPGGGRTAIVLLAIAFVAAVAVAGVLYANWHSKSNSLNTARSQLTAVQKQLATAQAGLNTANSQMASAQQSLTKASAHASQLQSELNAAKRQQSSGTAGSNPTVAGLQQQLSAADNQAQNEANMISALRVCANDEAVVITNELNGHASAASAALPVAEAACRAA